MGKSDQLKKDLFTHAARLPSSRLLPKAKIFPQLDHVYSVRQALPTILMYHNPSALSWKSKYTVKPPVLKFHKTIPDYEKTPLLKLPAEICQQLGVGTILLKDESHRFGLPSYKILGASWGCICTVAQSIDLPPTAPLSTIKQLVAAARHTFYTATDGNWGRAVARMAKILGATAVVYVPRIMVDATKRKIRQEGAEVMVVDGDYDMAVKEAERSAIAQPGGLLIEDTAWPGYEEIPQWVVDGYSTMMVEIDEKCQELTGRHLNLIVCPVGVGSLARMYAPEPRLLVWHWDKVSRHLLGVRRPFNFQDPSCSSNPSRISNADSRTCVEAVVAHYKSRNPPSIVMTVEPDTAACLKTSLENGQMTSISTGNTTMCGMNCGTVSMTAWPFLRDGVDASITVTDDESAVAQKMLADMEINMGPCSAASLAALLKISEGEKRKLLLNHESVIVLLGPEGPRGEAFDMS